MKKILSLLIVFTIISSCLIPFVAFAAPSASATLTGPSEVRAGDTITLTFNLSGTNIFGASGTLSFDANQVSFEGFKQKIASPWMVEFNGNSFVVYDNNLSSPINSSKAIFTLTFKVKSLAAGTNINISCSSVKATDGSSDASIGTVSYSKTIAAPKANNSALASLNVSNASISPAFSKNTKNYTATVPFETTKLQVSATAEDSKAKVSVNSPNLIPGGTTNVTVTVTAENGAKTTYTITVTRQNDPNYIASSNKNLASITVDGFFLSPVFSSDVTKYVVWLPFETEAITVGATAADSKASVEVKNVETLLAGTDNEIKVICTAENGSAKEYVIIAKRAAAHGEITPTATPDIPANDEPLEQVSSTGISPWWLVLVAVISLILGAILGILLTRRAKKNNNRFGKRIYEDF